MGHLPPPVLVSKPIFVENNALLIADETVKGWKNNMALAQADVLAGLKEIVLEVAGIPAADVELDKNFTEDLEVDSLSMVEVVVAAEERFGVKIPDDAVTDLVTVGDAVNFIVNAAK